jgi:SHS2 domain-containing protein
MPYRYLENIAIADIAFEARGKTLEELFMAAADATLNVMIMDLKTLASGEKRTLIFQEKSIDMLLYQLLEELIYFKDARKLLLRISDIRISVMKEDYRLTAKTYGETIDTKKHRTNVDVKAVTFHRLKVEKTGKGWQATVVLDI